jgi:hypothetical protein
VSFDHLAMMPGLSPTRGSGLGAVADMLIVPPPAGAAGAPAVDEPEAQAAV